MISPIFPMLLTLVGMVALPPTPDKIVLREDRKPGSTALVELEFNLHGDLLFMPSSDGKGIKSKFSGRGRIAFEEKMLAADAGSKVVTAKSLRHYNAASVESVVDDRRTVLELREPVRLVVNELRQGRPFLFSPSGPLTLEEEELLETALDSLTIGGLLPVEPVAVGDRWKPSDATAAVVFNLFTVTKNELDAKLESLDGHTARVRLQGKLEGTRYGAPANLSVAGQLLFDQALSQITRVEIALTQDQTPSPIEPGEKVEARFTLSRKADGPITHLNDKALNQVPLAANPATEQLVYVQPDGRYRFYLPRGWRIYQSTPRVVVLRLVSSDEFVAQCNVMAAPTVAAGDHMKPDEFRSQVQQALGEHFQKLVQEGEIPAEKGNWVYRLAVAGADGNRPVVWYYYLAAGPQGQQLVFIFTLDAHLVDQFGPQDLALVGSLDFAPARTASNQKTP